MNLLLHKMIRFCINTINIFIGSYIRFLVTILISCISAITLMYTLQYGFNFQPCHLCHIQRYLVISTISVIILNFLQTILLRKKNYNYVSQKITFLTSVSSTMLVVAMLAIAIYHIGVEEGIFHLSASCIPPDMWVLDSEALETIFLTQGLGVSCDRPQILFGHSIALWTFIGTLMLFLFTALFWSNIMFKILNKIKKSS